MNETFGQRTRPVIALVVFESMFGNTEQVAHAIADGLAESMEVNLREVTENPSAEPGRYDVIVVGGPTHAFTMSTTKSRAEAWRRGGRMGVIKTGIREWLDALPTLPPTSLTATFDTRVRRFPGSAARAATRRLARHGSASVVGPRSFYVLRETGPLAPGELDKARGWGRSIGILAGAQPCPDPTQESARRAR
jgi:hypothetical protein